MDLITELDSLNQQLKDLGTDYLSEKILIQLFIVNLDKSFGPTLDTIMAQRSMDRDFILSKLQDHERKLEEEKGISYSEAEIVNRVDTRPLTCWNCGQTGHHAAKCRALKQEGNSGQNYPQAE